MPIQPFHDNTAVAFIDISGFKQMMKNRQKAMETLAHFYETGYFTLMNHRRPDGPSVEGLFVSDCGILFVRHQTENNLTVLETLLSAVEDLNRRLFAREIQTTSSVAFGDFRYNPLSEYEGLEKNYIFGDAYIDAYSDTGATPKLDPGTCRILLKNFIYDESNPNLEDHRIWSRCRRKDNRLYFYWMCNTSSEIRRIKGRYEQANQSRFKLIHQTLKDCAKTWQDNWTGRSSGS